jgi:fructosamine-3-kinase
VAVFRKHSPDAPARSIAWEAAGLRWLAEATSLGGMPVARVLDVGAAHLDLERLTPVAPTRDAAGTFGERLARTHDSGAGTAYGAGPPGWSADGWFGPADRPLPLSLARHDSWAPFYAQERLLPIAAACRDAGALSPEQAGLLDRVAARLPEHDPGEPPSRIHGDLWAGNVVWTDDGATLIDPSAHAGHRETDLAMLALFGSAHLEVTLAAYQLVWPLADGWRARVGLHQLYPLAVHALLFGGGYAAQTAVLARRYV